MRTQLIALARPEARLRRASQQFVTFVRLLGLASWRSFVSFYSSNDLTFATSIAYYALLSLFPFLLLVLSMLGALTANEEERAAVLGFVLQYFPRQFEFVTTQLDALRGAHVTLGLAGSLLMIWASLGVFGALTSAVDHAWGVEQQRSFLKHKLVSFLMLVAASTLLLAVLILISLRGLLAASPAEAAVLNVRAVEGFLGLMARYGPMLLVLLVAGLVFYFVPNAKVRLRDVWPGALLTALLWRGAFFGFQWYLRDMSRLSVVHGSVAAVVAFLIWVYVSAVILLYGVEFTAAYARLRRHRPASIPAAPAPRT